MREGYLCLGLGHAVVTFCALDSEEIYDWHMTIFTRHGYNPIATIRNEIKGAE